MVIRRHFDLTLMVVLMTFVGLMIYLLTGLFKPMDLVLAKSILSQPDTINAVKVSLISIICSMAIVYILGTLLAYQMQHKKSGIYRMIHILLSLPLLLPPTVAGLVLLQGFGRQSLVSELLFQGKLHIAFQFTAIIVAQVFVTLPFFYQMTLNAFEDVDMSYIEAAQVFGANKWVVLRYILIPMSKQSMNAGIFMSSLRGLSEFGATIMFAGNMAGKTQTMTTRIYQLYQTDLNGAFVLAGFQLLLFIVPYMLFMKRT